MQHAHLWCISMNLVTSSVKLSRARGRRGRTVCTQNEPGSTHVTRYEGNRDKVKGRTNERGATDGLSFSPAIKALMGPRPQRYKQEAVGRWTRSSASGQPNQVSLCLSLSLSLSLSRPMQIVSRCALQYGWRALSPFDTLHHFVTPTVDAQR